MAAIVVPNRFPSKSYAGGAANLRLQRHSSRPCITRAVTGFQADKAEAPLQTDVQRSVRVRISTHFQAAFGEGLKVVGSHPVLGAWDLGAAPDMAWTDGHVWVSDLDVPDGADFEFKIVHLTYGGVSWEPSCNRPFKAAGVPEDAALEVACSFGYPELTAVQLTSASHVDDVSAAAWDPTVGGLPADLTNDLSQQAGKTLSAATDREDPASSAAQSGGTATWDEVRQAAPGFRAEAGTAPEQDSLASAAMAMVESTAASQDVPDAITAESLAEDGAAAEVLQQKEESPTEKANREKTMKAAGTLAVGLAAGVVMSALAIDLTDAAVAGAILAAGATFMPAKDAAGARKTASKVLSSGLGATEAIARGFGLKSHAERRAEAAVAAATQLPGGEEAAEHVHTAAEAERRLAASIAEAEALLAEEPENQDFANNIVPNGSSASPSAGVVLAAAALVAVNAEKAVQDSMEKIIEKTIE
ncbi:probable glucoamylase at N-terminal half [Coccomyxa sp. Obi]|nr:probable glucoamylase at N-terminal half [Coccomyxa sp. Obi]